MARLIEDYGLIGDGKTAALVSRHGSIDRLCCPRFDSDACFAALLGTEDHGGWVISPKEVARSDRRYQADTLIPETDFTMHGGAARVIDFMPISDDTSAVVRIVVGLGGKVRMQSTVNLRFDYGSMPSRLQCSDDGFETYVGPDRVILRSPVPIACKNDTAEAPFEVTEDETLAFALSYAHSTELPSPSVDPGEALAKDLGLLSEEYDLKRSRLSGNFPQALTHLALMQTAISLCEPAMRRDGSL